MPTVLKYMIQNKRFHGCQSTVERLVTRTAEATGRSKCRNPQEVTRFLDFGRGRGADILTLTFGQCYENLQIALAN